MNNRLFFIFLALLPFCGLSAQDEDDDFQAFRRQQLQEMDDFRSDMFAEFSKFRREALTGFANYLEHKWEPYQVEPKRLRPREDKPVTPPMMPKKDKILPTKPIKVPGKVEPVTIPKVEPKPNIPPTPSTPPAKPSTPTLPNIPNTPTKPTITPAPTPAPYVRQKFNVYGTSMQVIATSDMRISLSGVNEHQVASALRTLADDKYTPLVTDLAGASKSYNLNGWAVYQLVTQVAERLQGKDDANGCALMTAFLLNQLGYDTKLAYMGNRLLPLVSMGMDMVGYTYIKMGGKEYYIMAKNLPANTSIFTYRKNMEGATRDIDISNPASMKLSTQWSPSTSHAALSFPMASMQGSVNTNLIEYYKSIPVLAGYPWPFIARQPMSERLQEELLPPLKRAIAGKNEYDAVAILMNFMHYGFKYKTDDDQFGYEKPFYFEENFYYPFNDCEDRAILFSYLVRNLVGLDAALIYAPGHLWAAVCFKQNVNGDYVEAEGKRFVMCDPTFIGSSPGMCASKYKGLTYKVFPIPAR
ncbi:MAG: hypothetical protein K6F94_05085 [Bacteroidaceae bacterium]|nr:hypothetical protein [Bacteroidaceae bacterium]